jgi:MoxR-like ATPase
MDGRDHVLPDDVQTLAEPVLAHRLLPSTEARLSGRDVMTTLKAIVASTPVPAATHATAHSERRAFG